MNELIKKLALRAESIGITKHQFDFIVSSYNRSDRFYHNLKHIADCFDLYDRTINNFAFTQTEKLIIQLAIMYHDVVYDVKNHNGENELLSAALANYHCKSHDHEKLAYMIERSFAHKESQFACVNYFLDIDMSILGTDESSFKEYRDNIRKEYSIYDDVTFFKATVKFCNNLLTKRIYHTELFYREFEENAKNNLKKCKNEALKMLVKNIFLEYHKVESLTKDELLEISSLFDTKCEIPASCTKEEILMSLGPVFAFYLT